MVLPGIQALFGFQLIVVFNPGFDQKLGAFEQSLHLGAIALVAVAIALIMTPAAYHRQIGTHEVTETFLRISTRLLLLSMAPLCVGLCLEFYLVTLAIAEGWIAQVSAFALFALFVLLWFVLPRARSLQRLFGG